MIHCFNIFYMFDTYTLWEISDLMLITHIVIIIGL
jgi:hypothetical protein